MFQPQLLRNKKEKLSVIYKLLHDLLFILLVFLAISLLAEGILPGIISAHVGISKIIILVAGTIFLISLIAPIVAGGSKQSKNSVNRKIIFALSFFGCILLLNSLLKVNFILNLAITIMSLLTAYGVYAVVMRNEKNR